MGLQDHFLYIIGYGTALKCNKFVLLRRTTGRAGFQPARFARKSSTTVQSIQAMKRFVYTTLLLFLAAALAVQAQVSFSVAYKRINATTIDIVFTGTADAGWHIYSTNIADGGPTAASFGVDHIKGAKLKGSLKPGPGAKTMQDLIFEMPVTYFENKAVFTQRVELLEKDYELKGYQRSELVKLDILVNREEVDALSFIVHAETAYERGRKMCEKLKEEIPRQLFEIPIQAAIGSKIIARETVKAMRKDVLAKCYGGDISRKKKLREKQKEGKKRMRQIGNVEIPQKAFMSVLKLDDK